MRSHLLQAVSDPEGSLLNNAVVTVYDTAGNLLSQLLYFGPAPVPVVGSDGLPMLDGQGQPVLSDLTVSNPYTTPDGVIDLWLDDPARVILSINPDGPAPAFNVLYDILPPPGQMVLSATGLKILNTPSPGQVLLAITPTTAQWVDARTPSGGILPWLDEFTSPVLNPLYNADPAAWTIANGTITLSGNFVPLHLDIGQNQARISVRATLPLTSNTDIGLVLSGASSQQLAVYFSVQTNGTRDLVVLNGSTQLFPVFVGTLPNFADLQPHLFEINTVGTHLEVFIDGTLVARATYAANLPSDWTKAGFEADSRNTLVDRFAVTQPTALV